MALNPVTTFSRSLNYDTPPGLEVAAGSQGKIVRLSGQWTALALARDRATGHVNEVTGRGRHTSTSAVALALPGGGWIVDTPGVRAVGRDKPLRDAVMLEEPARA